mmetsp:Transcript_4552/g.16849  ORF Transcript_4552/g.16849 Transcript_4552/m.16849 type:complete len:101 (+) Transcript_4552:687-989(+)
MLRINVARDDTDDDDDARAEAVALLVRRLKEVKAEYRAAFKELERLGAEARRADARRGLVFRGLVLRCNRDTGIAADDLRPRPPMTACTSESGASRVRPL